MLKKILLTFILLLSPALIPAEAIPLPFDKAAAVKITSCDGSTMHNAYTKQWRSQNYVRFDNGLVAIYVTLWSSHEEALTMSKMTYTGKVNIVGIPDEQIDGSVIRHAFLEEGADYWTPVKLWVDPKYKVEKPLTISSIVETKEKAPHWFFEYTYHYAYTIELSDGSIWLLAKATQWNTPWKKGAELIKIGTSAKPIFINKTLNAAKATHYLDESHSLSDLQPLR